eukprot:10536-Heterococcus_DN1.PRE.2
MRASFSRFFLHLPLHAQLLFCLLWRCEVLWGWEEMVSQFSDAAQHFTVVSNKSKCQLVQLHSAVIQLDSQCLLVQPPDLLQQRYPVQFDPPLQAIAIYASYAIHLDCALLCSLSHLQLQQYLQRATDDSTCVGSKCMLVEIRSLCADMMQYVLPCLCILCYRLALHSVRSAARSCASLARCSQPRARY